MTTELNNAIFEIIRRNVISYKGDDTVMKGWHEISIGSDYIVRVTESLWSAWTGRRYLNGEEYHGPVYKMGTDSVYFGHRICTCSVCSESVPAQLKPN